MNPILIDDGTMDTVLQCPACGETLRFNPEPSDDPEWDRLAEAEAMFAEDHECECEEHEWDGFMTDAEADADVLASAGWGTDEDYGYFGGDE